MVAHIFWAEDRLSWIGTHMTMTGPLNLPLWYLRDLIIITLLTPVVYWLIRHFKIYYILIIAFAYISGIWPVIPGLTATTVLFFSIGAYLAINRKNIITTFRKIEKPSYILTLILLMTDTYYDGINTPIGFNLYHLYILFGVVSAFNIASRLLESNHTKVNKTLTNSVFFIYAFHTILIIGLYDKIINKLMTFINCAYLEPLVYITTPFAKAAICLFAYILLEKYMPRIMKPLTGNR